MFNDVGTSIYGMAGSKKLFEGRSTVISPLIFNFAKSVSLLRKLTRSVSQEIEPVLLSSEDDESGFLRTVQTTGIAV